MLKGFICTGLSGTCSCNNNSPIIGSQSFINFLCFLHNTIYRFTAIAKA